MGLEVYLTNGEERGRNRKTEGGQEDSKCLSCHRSDEQVRLPPQEELGRGSWETGELGLSDSAVTGTHVDMHTHARAWLTHLCRLARERSETLYVIVVFYFL